MSQIQLNGFRLGVEDFGPARAGFSLGVTHKKKIGFSLGTADSCPAKTVSNHSVADSGLAGHVSVLV